VSVKKRAVAVSLTVALMGLGTALVAGTAAASDLHGGGDGGSGSHGAGPAASGGDLADSPGSSTADGGVTPAGVPVVGTAQSAAAGATSVVPGGSTGPASGGY
jgi:hypothetical protein